MEAEIIPPTVVADAVQRARRAAGISTAELGRRLEVDEREIVAIENAEVMLEEFETFRIGDALGTGIHLMWPGFELQE